MLHAFRLRAEYEGLDPDTTISLTDGSGYDVGKAFQDAPDGLVVLDDENTDDVPRIHALDAYFATKTAAVPEDLRKQTEDAKAKEQAKAERAAAKAAASPTTEEA